MAPGKYSNRAPPLCTPLIIFYLICLLKFTMLPPKITTLFTFDTIVGEGLFCLFKGTPRVCLAVRASSIVIK